MLGVFTGFLVISVVIGAGYLLARRAYLGDDGRQVRGCWWRPMGRRRPGTREQCCCGGSRTLEPAWSARILR
ncbi:hypothetical protein ACFVY1_41930 [Streptomyces sp. NPDC058293]|uniref:hypothetical protein n=1 Tax=Streptomyces sp. NPDC058293 TaxID=3346429 RepID=UPI0036E22FD5